MNRRVPIRPSISSPADEWLYTLKNHLLSWISWLLNLFVVQGRHDGKAVLLYSFSDSSGTVQHIATTFGFRHAVKTRLVQVTKVHNDRIHFCLFWQKLVIVRRIFMCQHNLCNEDLYLALEPFCQFGASIVFITYATAYVRRYCGTSGRPRSDMHVCKSKICKPRV